jgi:hypothetical protein
VRAPRFACGVFFGVLASGCGDGSASGPYGSGSFPTGVVARAGDEWIHAATVMKIADVQKVGRDEALSRAIADAILAQAGEARAAGSWLRRYAERAGLARSLLARLEKEAEDQGPPTKEELDALVESRWWEFARPELRRAVHAVVLVKEEADDARARELAEKIRAAVVGASDPAAFLEAARGVPRGTLKVRAEKLSPCTSDGRVVEPKSPPRTPEDVGQYDRTFAAGLFALDRPGAVSAPFRSAFGYHVALLVEIIAPKSEPRAKLESELASVIYQERARAAREALLAHLKEESPPIIDRAALSLTKESVLVR